MRVLHVNTEPTWRGGERQMCFLIEGLGAFDVENHVVFKKGSYLHRHSNSLFGSKVRLFSLPLKGEFDLYSAKMISRYVDEFSIDLIHCHTSHAHTIAFFAKVMSKKKPKVLVTRRVDFDIYKKSSFRPFTRVKYLYMADHYIAISRKIKEIMVEDGVDPDKVSIVYSGVKPHNLESSGERLKREFNLGNGVLFLGNIAHIAPHKHHENLIEAFSMVSKEAPEAVLFVVGGGERLKKIQDLSKKLGIESRVIFTGFREDAKDFFSIFDLFVVSSREEGLCTSIIDAFFSGVPVVATDAGGIPELVKDGETGVIAKKEDPESLAKAILWAIDNMDAMAEMAERAKLYASQNFTVERMVEGNYKVYRNLIYGRE